jgi:hypothetical protein
MVNWDHVCEVSIGYSLTRMLRILLEHFLTKHGRAKETT